MGATSTDVINTVIAPGLPEISGTLTHLAYGKWLGIIGTGAFSSEKSPDGELGNGDNEGGTYKVTFSASKSSSIYGRSATVQPPAFKTWFLIKHD